jgi:hypothetical protein
MPNTTQTNNKQQGCVTFKVNDNQSIHDRVNAQQNLPIPSKFICRNSDNPNQIVYPKKNGAWRETGRGIQNIYSYFTSPDASYAKQKNYESNTRWIFIQEEMKELNIKQITVTVCPL